MLSFTKSAYEASEIGLVGFNGNTEIPKKKSYIKKRSYVSYTYTFILLMMMKSIVWKLLYFLDEKISRVDLHLLIKNLTIRYDITVEERKCGIVFFLIWMGYGIAKGCVYIF